MDGDVDEALPWTPLHGGAVDENVEGFGKLDDSPSYADVGAHDSDASATTVALQPPPDANVHVEEHHDCTHSSERLHGTETAQQLIHPRTRIETHVQDAKRPTRFKRKNFSKRLQWLCLERYARHAQAQGRLPDRTQCELLLHQSHAQFLREGGGREEPRFSYHEFLKLIRNRRRERQERTFQSYTSSPSMSNTTEKNVTTGKRKLREQLAKIDALIAIIDQLRPRRHQALVRNVRLHAQRVSPHAMDSGTVDGEVSRRQEFTEPPWAMSDQGTPRALPPSNGLIHTILQVQHDTIHVQEAIEDRLRNIELLHPSHHEPSSASV